MFTERMRAAARSIFSMLICRIEVYRVASIYSRRIQFKFVVNIDPPVAKESLARAFNDVDVTNML
jgi:hypothetical protein